MRAAEGRVGRARAGRGRWPAGARGPAGRAGAGPGPGARRGRGVGSTRARGGGARVYARGKPVCRRSGCEDTRVCGGAGGGVGGARVLTRGTIVFGRASVRGARRVFTGRACGRGCLAERAERVLMERGGGRERVCGAGVRTRVFTVRVGG